MGLGLTHRGERQVVTAKLDVRPASRLASQPMRRRMTTRMICRCN